MKLIFSRKMPFLQQIGVTIPLSLTIFRSPKTLTLYQPFSTLTEKRHFAKTQLFQHIFNTFYQFLRIFFNLTDTISWRFPCTNTDETQLFMENAIFATNMGHDTPIIHHFLQPKNIDTIPSLFNFDRKTPFWQNTTFSTTFQQLFNKFFNTFFNTFYQFLRNFFNIIVTISQRFPCINTDETHLFMKNASFATNRGHDTPIIHRFLQPENIDSLPALINFDHKKPFWQSTTFSLTKDTYLYILSFYITITYFLYSH